MRWTSLLPLLILLPGCTALTSRFSIRANWNTLSVEPAGALALLWEDTLRVEGLDRLTGDADGQVRLSREDVLAELESLFNGNGGATFNIPEFFLINERVEESLRYFLGPRREHFARWLSRMSRYTPAMQAILREQGLPEDLVYVAMVESGFNPHAYSRARAVGPWQFMLGTARLYGLRVDWWIDERRDSIKATHAAARYLKDLHDELGSWYLAAAAYNSGIGRIRRAIREAGTRDFWELANGRYLPRETRDHIPRIIAAALIAKEPEKYGFTEIPYQEPLAFELVEVPDATDLKVVARAAGMGYEDVVELNPELRRWATPPQYANYRLKIPPGRKVAFERNFAAIPLSERLTFRRHRVRWGETLSEIALRYGTSVRPIMELNGLRDPRRLRAGKTIIIPVPAGRGAG